MEDLIRLIPLIIIALFWVLGRARKQRQQQSDPEVMQEREPEITLPPWGNLPMEGGKPPRQQGAPDRFSIESEPPSAQPPAVPTIQSTTPPPMPHRVQAVREIEPPTRKSDTPQVPTIAGIPLSPETFRQGIILSEILGRPKSLRRRGT
ncbi:hypothetical protein HYR99_29405 [Candidatus Poribacteria bacterium]|nr:hypothetical protein [Candidatus Poribacteria bacterium]